MPCCIKDGKPGNINPKTKECEEECDCDPSDPMSPKGVKVMFTLVLYATIFHITNAGVNLRILPIGKRKLSLYYLFVSSFHYLYFISNFFRLFDAEGAAVQHLDLYDHYAINTFNFPSQMSDGSCKCEMCPDNSVKRRRSDGKPECPCLCKDSTERQMNSDGSCPVSLGMRSMS